MDTLLHSKFQNTKVLITGATGFTGKVLTRKLVKAGAQVRAIARTSSNLDDLQDLEIEWFRGEVFHPELVALAAQDVDYIFHVAAAFREVKDNDEGYRQVHVHSTQLLTEAVKDNPSFKRFVHVSTVGVHGHIPGDDLADEHYRFSPGDGYQRTKLEAEQWFAAYAEKHNIPWTIIRPTPIYGPGDRRLLKFFKMVNNGYFLMLGRGKGIYHLIHVWDLTEIFLLAATSDKALSEIFIAANDKSISMIDMARIIAQALNKKVRIVRLPIWPFFLAADICKVICKPFGIQPPLYRRRVAFYTKDRKFDISKLRNVLGYTMKYSNKTGLTETAKWYIDRGWLS
ncbi:MAG: NAD(P)-dependent oxidoreductase [Desulfobulbus sp.]|nr:MAG: NAD(P)-dependent oxidoreductase [Desulfobulbus sp.]